MKRKKSTKKSLLLFLGIAVVIIILLFSGFVIFPAIFSLSDYEPYEGWKLEGEIFDRESYEGLADIILSGTIDYIEPSWVIEPTVPGTTPHPTEYWFNIWYKEEGTDTWIIVSGVEDQTTIGMAIPEDILYNDFNYIKHPALIYISSEPLPLHPAFALEWGECDFLVELDGELRVDVRVDMFYPVSIHVEHTIASDYASISSVGVDDADGEVSTLGFELIIVFSAVLFSFYIFKKKKK